MSGRLRFLVVFFLMTGAGFAQNFVGFVDGYYGYNFDKPGSGKNLYRNFDIHHNQFSLNYAELSVDQKPSPIGFRADIGFGDAANTVHAAEPAGLDAYRFLQQAYVSAAKNKFQVDFGKFVTPAGAEVIETKDNWNYSRSLLFAWAIPYYHFGARATYSVNDKVSLTGMLTNGWNNVVDNNEGKTGGGQISIKPTKTFTFTETYIGGKEQANDAVRHLTDTVAQVDVTPKLSLMANYDYGMDRVGRGLPRVKWQGIAVYGRINAMSRLKLSPRLEWFDDAQGFMTGRAQKLKEGTMTAEIALAENSFVRGEYRYDWSNQRVFDRGPIGLLSHQSTLTIGVVYTYSKTR